MNKILYINVLMLFFTTSCGSQESRLIESFTVTQSDYYKLLSEYIDLYISGNQILQTNSGESVVDEDYRIIYMSCSSGDILYTYGYGDVSVPVMKIQGENKKVLDDIIINNSGSVFYRVITFLEFINENDILFSAINPITLNLDIGIYNYISHEKKIIMSIDGALISDYFNNELIYYVSNEYGKKYYSLNIETKDVHEIDISGMNIVYSVGNRKYIGLGEDDNPGVFILNITGEFIKIENNAIGILKTDDPSLFAVLLGDHQIEEIAVYQIQSEQ